MNADRRSRAIARSAAVACALAVLLGLACDMGSDPPSTESQDALHDEPSGPLQPGDWLVLHLASDPENLNPLTSNDAGASSVLAWIFPPLVTLDAETLEQRPLLAAELPEISADHRTYTYRLRPGITFSDGTPLTAHDVVFTVKAIRHPRVNAPHARNYYESVRDVVALDDLTLRIELREVYFRNEWVLGAIQPIPRHYYDPHDLLAGIRVSELDDWEGLDPLRKDRALRFAKSFNEDFQRRPLGPGAYALEDPKRDFVTGERIVLRHRANHWAPGDTDLGDGWVDRVLFRVINDSEGALVAMKAGSLDVLGLRPLQHLKQTTSPRFTRRFAKHIDVYATYTYIGWNQKRAVFRDTRVRRALSMLVDKRNIVDKVMLGLAEPVESPIFRERPEYNRALEPFPFDPARARALLAEAGWSDTNGDGILDREIAGERVPLRIEILSNAGNDERKKVGLVVIDELKRAGIDASFRAVDWSILLDRVRNFDYDAVILGWAGGGSTPPDVYQIWHSSQAVAGGSNFIAYSNREVDRILERYRIEFDPAHRKRLYDRFQEILYEEQPYTFLYAPKGVTAWDRRFRGVRWYPVLGTEYNEWWVPRPLQRYP
jgi:peptide/nickel transport system substrate-binding protein